MNSTLTTNKTIPSFFLMFRKILFYSLFFCSYSLISPLPLTGEKVINTLDIASTSINELPQDCNTIRSVGGVGQVTISNIPAGASIEIEGPATNFLPVIVCDGNCNPTETVRDLLTGEYTIQSQIFTPAYCFAFATVSVTNRGSRSNLLNTQGSDCSEEDLVINDNPIAANTYATNKTITSSGTVAANSTVTFSAAQSITLQPGFHAVAESDFRAEIDTCTAILPACIGEQGGLLLERWNDISGFAISDLTDNINYPNTPNVISRSNGLAIPSDDGDNYGQRLRGYIQAPETGSYIFNVTGNNNVQVFLSTDREAANATQIASLTGFESFTEATEHNKFPSQTSAAIHLLAGEFYYLEIFHKELTGSDHLNLFWKTPTAPDDFVQVPASQVFSFTCRAPMAPVISTCAGEQGGLLVERWNNIAGIRISDLTSDANYPNNPSTTSISNGLNFPSNDGDDYGQRIRGLIQAPETGSYTFNVTGNNMVQVFLSTTEIASVKTFTDPLEHDKLLNQTSVAINLIAGEFYYLEILHKEGSASDHVNLFWKTPTATDDFVQVPASQVFSFLCQTPVPPVIPACAGEQGGLLVERWNNINGFSISDLTDNINYPNTPNVMSISNGLAVSSDDGDNYGQRLRGYIQAPETGNYTFNVTGNNNVRVFLSTDSEAANATQIASLTGFIGFTEATEQNKFPSQTSAAINLEAGEFYYLEIFHKESGGSDHLNLFWKTPTASDDFVQVPASQVFSFTCRAPMPPIISACAGEQGGLLVERWNNIEGNNISDLTNAADYPNNPSIVSISNGLSIPSNDGDDYGRRIRGFIQVPQTGSYTFNVTGNNTVKVFLSTIEIASVETFTIPMEHNKFPNQTSVPINLIAGEFYYLEILHKEARGDDHVNLFWKTPTAPDDFVQVPASQVFSFLCQTPVPPVIPACAGEQGGLLVERWNNIAGTTVSDLTSDANYPNNPSIVSISNGLNLPSNTGDDYGQRIRGYIQAPQTGNYTFNVTGDDNVQVFLSTDSEAANALEIASVEDFTAPLEHDKFSSQTSAPINLEAGEFYYLEILYKEGSGGDHVNLFWKTPAVPDDFVQVSTSRLFSYTCSTSTPVISDCAGEQGGLLVERWDNIEGNDISDLTSAANYPNSPSIVSISNGLSIFSNDGNNYGQRIRGYIQAPETGSYTFNVTGNNRVQVFLSTDEEAANALEIASVEDFTAPLEHDKLPSQTSAAINLEAGELYYLEILHKEASGDDHVNLFWKTPSAPADYVQVPASQVFSYTCQAVRPLPACAGEQGGLLLERWNRIGGSSISDLRSDNSYPDNPSSTNISNGLNFPSDNGDNYGQRISGYIQAPETGSYTFNVTGDNDVVVFLSTTQEAANVVDIASITGFTGPTEHDRFPSQTSAVIDLVAGEFYYLGILHKEGGGGDHLNLFWKTPSAPNNYVQVPAQQVFSYTCQAVSPTPLDCAGEQGGLLLERWNNVGGVFIDDLINNANYPNNPSTVSISNGLNFPSDDGDDYGQRARGYIQAPETGSYTFNVTGDNNVDVFLSRTESERNIELISFLFGIGFTGPTEHNRFFSQTSTAINLEAGEFYYLEVLHKEAGGEDHVNLFWKTPSAPNNFVQIPANQVFSYACGGGAASVSISAAMLDFTAIEEEGQVNLQWLTNTTDKNDYYVLEKSTDGATFEPLTQVANDQAFEAAAFRGSSIDENPILGANYYRLKQVYKDGTYDYTAVKRINFRGDLETLSVFPNPVAETLFVNLKAYAGKQGSLQIVNQFGQLVKHIELESMPAQLLQVDLKGIQSGAYFMTIAVENVNITTRKIAVLKRY